MLGENTALSQNADDGPGRTPAVLCDRFVLETQLDQGRLGRMYRARDRLRAQEGRPYVAVLILPSEVARSPAQLAAFEHALGAVRMLSHPNIVRIFSLERDGETAFLVLEWVDGESLRSVIESLAPETVCEADALGVVRAVGNALVYAHARGVVHGDIRPENVLVTERGEVRLLFASACLAQSAPFSIGPRDDVRGLAALAYELMAGSPPPIGGLYPRGKADEPEPIEGLSRRRWKALKSAMSVRDGRVSSVKRLLAALDLPEPRAPRRGSRPDRIRDAKGGVVKRAAVALAVGAGIVALALGGLHLWNERGDELPDVSTLPATVESGADRAADITREGLSGARQGLERAGDALATLWGEVGRRVDGAAGTAGDESRGESPAEGVPGGDPDAAGAGAADAVEGNARSDAEPEAAAAGVSGNEAVREAELFGANELNGSATVDAGEDAESSAAGESRARVATAEARARAEDAPVVNENRVIEDVPLSNAANDAPSRSNERSAAERSGDASNTPANETAAASAAARRIVFSTSEYVVSESEGVAAIEVARADSSGDVSFVWWTRDASAEGGDDYADLGRSVEQIRAGETAAVLYVPITSDSIIEDREEYFEIHLGVLSGEGNQSGALESARVTIIDDDR